MPEAIPSDATLSRSTTEHLKILPLLCTATAAQFPAQAACIAATALLVTAAEQFGVSLRPQPVSTWSGDAAGQSATGHRARDYSLSIGGKVNSNNVPTESSSWFKEVGHLVAVSDDFRLLLDPTYGQFGRPGTTRQSVMMQVPSMALTGEEAWTLTENGWVVRYWPVDTPDGWKSEYAAAQRLLVPQHLLSVLQLVHDQIEARK